MAKSIEEKVEEHYKKLLDDLKIQRFGKTDEINGSIAKALKEAESKSGGSGMNFPDIQLLLENKYRRDIPVMIEAKGTKGKLEKLNKSGEIDLSTRSVQQYAVNGALHYGLAILAEGTYQEVVIIGINGTETDEEGNVKDPEAKAYYISDKNGGVPKEIPGFDPVQMKESNLDAFFAQLDGLVLTEAEKEKLKRSKEALLEKSVNDIHQRIYKDASIDLLPNDKLFLFCGLIMAGLTTVGIKPLEVSDLYGNDDKKMNDGAIILDRADSFLRKKGCPDDKVDKVIGALRLVFTNEKLWQPKNGESKIKSIYKTVKEEIIPLLESNLHLDFTGKILNTLGDWVDLDNDQKHDVVLTPRMVTSLMARMARTDMDSFVWDTCMGSSGFLVSAMEIMIDDARNKIKDVKKLDEKIDGIKHKQLLGIEKLPNVFILAVLNMILMGDGSSQIICGDSHQEVPKFMNEHKDAFPANVFLLNPPYSAPGKGLNFVDEALSLMLDGYGAVLIQENAGSGQGGGYGAKILQHSTLLASVRMPQDLFKGKSDVHTAIYLFKVGRKHEEDDLVTFVDFSNDGYTRRARRKSTSKVNLVDTDHALERYDELLSICLGKKPKTDYYTEQNGLVIRDTITLSGKDWTFSQHKKISTVPTEDDFKKTVGDYLRWKADSLLKGDFPKDGGEK